MLSLALTSMEGAESPGAGAVLRRLMTGVAKRTSPSAGFFGSSTGVAFRGLTIGLGGGVATEFVLREAAGKGVFFGEAGALADGDVTEEDATGSELAAATETSGCETGLETGGAGSGDGEAAG